MRLADYAYSAWGLEQNVQYIFQQLPIAQQSHISKFVQILHYVLHTY